MLPHDMVAAAMTTFSIARRAFLGAGLAAGAAMSLVLTGLVAKLIEQSGE